MVPAAYDVWLARVQYNNSADPRPVIVLDCLTKDRYLVINVTGQMDLFRDLPDQLRIERRDLDFDKTGLPRDECFIDGNQVREISQADFIKQYGTVTGQLKIKFDRWYY